jgi:2-polyprenyl-3-methyl-5-hydroxy-6-metoxy-1,4-benzoquinol methylase
MFERTKFFNMSHHVKLDETIDGFLMGSLRENKPLSRAIKEQILGITYLFLHPHRLKRVILRETRYRQRYKNKQVWLEWQEFDQYEGQCDHDRYIANVLHGSEEAQLSPLHVARIQIISDMISRLGKGLNVLDVGCGNGVISEHIWKMGNSVACADLPKMTPLTHKRRALLVVSALAEQLAFASNSFDVVIASEMVEHLWKPQNFLDEAHRVLKMNGHLIIETPEGKEGLYYDSHKHYFTVERIKQMLGARFTLCEVKRLEATGAAQTPTIIVLLRKSAAA